MNRSLLLRMLSLLFASALVAAACGDSSDTDTSTDDDSEESSGDEETSEDEAMEDDAMEDDAMEDDAMEDDAMEEGAHSDLSAVCPSPLVVQTDWFPEAEHGMLYELIGEGYTVDTDNLITSGPMVSEGVELGIDFEVRAGGPAIGFAPVSSYMYTDDSIHLGYQNTEAQVLAFGDTPMISVMAPLEKNPQMIMWDSETYPDITSIADLGTEGVVINVFGGGVFAEVFAAQGLISADQFDPSYDGSPARFISEGGAIAQQGFASAEPYNYENVFEEWAKPVSYQLLHDAGFEVYAATIAVRPDAKADLDACLAEVVPIMQTAVVTYTSSPDRANAIIVDAVEQIASFWVYDDGLAAFSVAAQKELGLVGNGPDSTVGNIDLDRVQAVIDQISEAGLDTAGVTAEDIVTNEYIDDSIGL